MRARRDEADTIPPPRSLRGEERPLAPEPETVAERTARIERKISLATLVLERLSPTDARARLLASAVLRRDEVLLDAILAEMTDEVVGATTRRGPGRGW